MNYRASYKYDIRLFMKGRHFPTENDQWQLILTVNANYDLS